MNHIDATTQTAETEAPAYTPALVSDAGQVVAVTNGTAQFDTADDTQYKV